MARRIYTNLEVLLKNTEKFYIEAKEMVNYYEPQANCGFGGICQRMAYVKKLVNARKVFETYLLDKALNPTMNTFRELCDVAGVRYVGKKENVENVKDCKNMYVMTELEPENFQKELKEIEEERAKKTTLNVLNEKDMVVDTITIDTDQVANFIKYMKKYNLNRKFVKVKNK